MAKVKRISPRKEPVQKRSVELRDSILQAATYILKKEGPQGFTTNKVAEKAGVNIASFYQYYPNKESLLFHLVEMEWESTIGSVFPILREAEKSPAQRLHLFIERFYETEAAEGHLRRAVGAASMLIEETREYQKLMGSAEELFTVFLAEALKENSKAELQRKSQFIQHTITSFSEGMPPEDWDGFRKDAKMMADMLCEHFGIE